MRNGMRLGYLSASDNEAYKERKRRARAFYQLMSNKVDLDFYEKVFGEAIKNKLNIYNED